MTAGIITEALSGDFSMPFLQQEYDANTVTLRKRWLPDGTDTYDLTDFDTAVEDGYGLYRNPGGSTDITFTAVTFLLLRVRAYDDTLPGAGTITMELTDLFVDSFTTPALAAGGAFLLAVPAADAYTVLATTAIQLLSTGADNLAVDLLISGL